MTLVEAVRKGNIEVQNLAGTRWLMWDEEEKVWMVWEKKKGFSRVIAKTNAEAPAVEALLNDNP